MGLLNGEGWLGSCFNARPTVGGSGIIAMAGVSHKQTKKNTRKFLSIRCSCQETSRFVFQWSTNSGGSGFYELVLIDAGK